MNTTIDMYITIGITIVYIICTITYIILVYKYHHIKESKLRKILGTAYKKQTISDIYKVVCVIQQNKENDGNFCANCCIRNICDYGILCSSKSNHSNQQETSKNVEQRNGSTTKETNESS